VGEPFEFLIFATFGLSLSVKFLAASEAGRRFSDDRQNGALELLLTTPLKERDIVSGHRRALWAQFRGALIFVAALFLSNLWLMLTSHTRRFHDPVLPLMMIGNVVVLFTDFYAITWTGLWAGLQARQHFLGVLGTVARVLFIPWLAYFLMGFAGFPLIGELSFFVCWFSFGVVNDLLWARYAKKRLRTKFRATVAGLGRSERKRWAGFTPRQVPA